MYIEKQKVRGRTYLQLVESNVITTEDGKRKQRRHIVERLGVLEDLEDGKPDYLERLRISFREGRPLLKALEKYVEPGKYARTFRVEFVEGSLDCNVSRYCFAGELLDVMYRELGLTRLFVNIKHEHQLTYDLGGIVRLLVFGRFLNPRSKIATMSDNDGYFEPPVSDLDFNEKYVYRALDIIWAHRARIFRAMDSNIRRKKGRDLGVILYDVTNVWCENEKPDEDIMQGDEIVKQGLRRYGKSKENRKKPIVQVSLFADREGIPLAMKVFPGNVPDVSTARPSLNELMGIIPSEKFIFVADRGITSFATCVKLSDLDAGYVISKSIAKSSEENKNWILEETGWRDVGADFRYKSRTRTERGENAEGKTVSLKVKTVVYWSRKYYEKEVADHTRMVAFLESLQNEDGYIPVDRLEKGYVKKGFQKYVIVREENGIQSGQVIDKKDLLQVIDLEKMKKDIALFGYYQIVTSEVDMPDTEVIRIYKNLVEIETEFHTLKGTFDFRPMYVRTPEHIEAHMVVCFVALTMLRLFQKRIVSRTEELQNSDLQWTWGLSGDRIRAALNDWQVISYPNDLYGFSHSGSRGRPSMITDDLGIILKACDISVPLRLFTSHELKSMKGKFNVL